MNNTTVWSFLRSLGNYSSVSQRMFSLVIDNVPDYAKNAISVFVVSMIGGSGAQIGKKKCCGR